MKTIVWGNYKGGVGKTTSVFQVATYFAQEGKSVLLIDLDPQCSLSHICSNSNGDRILSSFHASEVFNYLLELYIRYINSTPGIDFKLLRENDTTCISGMLSDIIIKLKKLNFKNNLFYIPSSISFENCRINELAQRMDRNVFSIFVLNMFIRDLEELDFDYLFIDCPPTSNVLIQSAFLASDYYIVPTIVDEISTQGVADYISEIEKTWLKYSLNSELGGILVNKVFQEKSKLIGIFETIYKERRGNADNHDQIISLDNNINSISGVKAMVSDDKFTDLRYQQSSNGFATRNIFKYYIGHRDNRTNGESIAVNTSHGQQTASYKNISKAILQVLES